MSDPCTPTLSDVVTVCVGGKTLVFTGGELTAVNNADTVPDGQYNEFTIQDGCLVGASKRSTPSYIPPTCCPTSNAPGTGVVTVSPESSNLTRQSVAGILTQVYFTGNVTGAGTATDPFAIQFPSVDIPNINAGSGPITVVGSNPVVIGHQASALSAGTYGDFTVDDYGHVTGYNQSASSLPPVAAPVVIDSSSSVDTLTLEKSLPQQFTATLGGTTITFSRYGILTNVVTGSSPLVAGTFTTADGKTVAYNENGVIVSVT